MSTDGPPVNTGRIQGKFAKGHSGNSAGKPRGARHYTTRLASALIEGEAERLLRKLVELALAGDVAALRVCVDRIVPVRRDQPVHFKIEVGNHPDGLITTFDQVLKAVGRGELTPNEGATIAGIMRADAGCSSMSN